MKFLIDNALSPFVAATLQKAGVDAVHIREYHLQSASDEEVFDLALQEERVLVSADTDFGTILASKKVQYPSLILFRHEVERQPAKQASLIIKNLSSIRESLEKGCIIVFEYSRIRIRPLPI